jgi:enoyl-CoA hydratase/carnithine racemase
MIDFIQTEQQGRVLIARLGNPHHGLMNNAMVAQLLQLVIKVDKDPDIGAVIFTGGHPDIFISHFDIAELLDSIQDAPPMSAKMAGWVMRLTAGLCKIPGVRSLLEKSSSKGLLVALDLRRAMFTMSQSGTVFIAAINGICEGGGMEVALGCDIRLLSDQAQLSQPEILLGFPPGGGGTQRLVRLFGQAKTMELVLSGKRLTAQQALEWGLASEVIPHENLLARVTEYAQQLTTRSKLAVAASKQAINNGGDLTLEKGIALEGALFIGCLGQQEAQQACAAYLQDLKATQELPFQRAAARKTLDAGELTPFNLPK